MVVLHPRGEPAPFFAHVAAAPLSVLLLDYDGTLAPFHMRPNEALPYAGVQERVMDIVRSSRTRHLTADWSYASKGAPKPMRCAPCCGKRAVAHPWRF